MKLKFLLMLVLFLLTPLLQAKENVIDFEGEVIEGERKRPELYLQLSNVDMDMGEIIYLRENFNDYLESDKYMKPRYFKFKKESEK